MTEQVLHHMERILNLGAHARLKLLLPLRAGGPSDRRTRTVGGATTYGIPIAYPRGCAMLSAIGPRLVCGDSATLYRRIHTLFDNPHWIDQCDFRVKSSRELRFPPKPS